MKKLVKVTIAIVLGVMVVSATNAQRRMGQEFQRGLADGQGFRMQALDLSEEQESQIKDIHLKLQKEILPLKNKLNENEAKLNTLQTEDSPDMKAIDKLIDTNSEIMADIRKHRVATHQAVRSVLSEDQRVIFDSRKPRDGFNRRGGRFGQHAPMDNSEFRRGEGRGRQGRY